MAMSKGPGALLELAEDRHIASLVKDWDFSKGRAFEDAVFSSYMSSVHHPSSSPSGAFHLLAVFHRFTFWLTDASVSLALHACLGGAPTGFHVEFLKDRHYRFSVASRKVGFAVSDLKRIITPHFDVYFHLWRDGGANWECELRLWKEEEAASWQTVLHRRNRHTSSSSKHVSFAKKLVQDSPEKKSVPPEAPDSIKFGTLDFPVDDYSSEPFKPQAPNPSIKPSDLNSNLNHKDIPSGRAFDRIKTSLFNRRPSSSSRTLDRIESSTTKDLSSLRCGWCLRLGIMHGYVRTLSTAAGATATVTKKNCASGNGSQTVDGFQKSS
jgi:hypothetical protein